VDVITALHWEWAGFRLSTQEETGLPEKKVMTSYQPAVILVFCTAYLIRRHPPLSSHEDRRVFHSPREQPFPEPLISFHIQNLPSHFAPNNFSETKPPQSFRPFPPL
jgi:hypothetical protein